MFTEDDVSKLIQQAIDTAFNKFKSGYYQDAEIILTQILKVNPSEPHAVQLLGLVKYNTSQFTDAIDLFRKALEIEPENPENYNNLGLCYSGMGRYDEAITALHKAIKLKPACAYSYSNLGLQYRHKEDVDSAIQCFQNSLVLEDSDITWGMLGGCYGEKRELSEAEKCFNRAIEINPNFAGAHVDLANVYHLQGHWGKAWEEYEWRHKVFEQLKIWKLLYDPEKQWKGQSLAGKKIVVYGEQGLGDTIQFFRYVKLLDGNVTVHCAKELESLLANHAEVYVGDPTQISREMLPAHDYHCSLLSLPYLLKDTLIPTNPYLWTARRIDVGNYSNYLKIGIVWAGNPQHPNDAKRSCHLANFRGIHNIPGVKLFSLVKDTRPRIYRLRPDPVDLTEGANDMKIVDMAPMMNTFTDTAAIINSLDLVISVDTAVLHLAGAMGKPTWALLPWACDWRWSLVGEEDDTIWYPSVRVFRQLHQGNWDTVFLQVEREIQYEQRIHRKERSLPGTGNADSQASISCLLL